MRIQAFTISILILMMLSGFTGCFEQKKQPEITGPLDSDGDGLSDEVEISLGTNKSNYDSDNDGVFDFFETLNGTALDTDSDGFIDVVDNDDDGDSIQTNNEHPDNNNDGNPSDALDTDKDGIPDYLDNDDDNDGILTVTELAYNMTLSNDIDHDGILNYLDVDSDNDTISDQVEGTGDRDGDTIPNFLDENDDDGPLGDLDGDGVSNQDEGFSEPSPPDSNDDGIPDYLDPESNESSIKLSIEQQKFIGSWHNNVDPTEHWTFYEDGTQKFSVIVTDNPPGEPYVADLWFDYTIENGLFCQVAFSNYGGTPTCYSYEFFENDMNLKFYDGEVQIVELIRD